jgi:hypothetical protein
MKQQGMESCSWRARHFKVLFVLSVLLKLVPSSFATELHSSPIMDEPTYNKYLSHYIGKNQDVAAEVHTSPIMDEPTFENYLSHYIGKNQGMFPFHLILVCMASLFGLYHYLSVSKF